MVNIIWGIFIVVGIIYALLTGRIDVINEEILNSTKTALDLMMKIFPVLALWLGIMNIAKVSGLMKKMSKAIEPFLGKLFPEIPKGHESLSLIASNIIVNMFGLGSAATPFGLKAMKSLQELNPKKDTATRSMVTFLIINTGGVTIIPTTIISLRMMHNSQNPTEIVLGCILATATASISGILMDYFINKRRKNV